MRILAIERELKPFPSTGVEEILREEAEAVWALQKQEVIREIWFTVPEKLAVILLECPGKEEAERHLSTLPLVQNQLIAFDVHALRAYDGFDRMRSCPLANGGTSTTVTSP